MDQTAPSPFDELFPVVCSHCGFEIRPPDVAIEKWYGYFHPMCFLKARRIADRNPIRNNDHEDDAA